MITSGSSNIAYDDGIISASSSAIYIANSNNRKYNCNNDYTYDNINMHENNLYENTPSRYIFYKPIYIYNIYIMLYIYYVALV